MGQLKTKVKQLASFFPPLCRLLTERDDLLRKNARLDQELATAAHELKTVRAKFFKAWRQREEVWVPPGHFYSPIPAIFDLTINQHDLLEWPLTIGGVQLNEKAQLALLEEFEAFYRE